MSWNIVVISGLTTDAKYAIKLISNPPADDITVPNMAKAMKKEN